jgi:hypothetical protein
MSVGVMTVGVMSVGEITVGVMTVGVMRRPHTNYIVFSLTRLRIESTINHIRGEHANHYTTDAVHRL